MYNTLNINDMNFQKNFSFAIQKMSEFFRKKGFVEVHAQSHLSILAACEDPTTIGSFHYTGNVWPLPQTNQMNLEEILLKNSNVEGVFCQTTSYRQEANPIPGRHDLIFPMFEFESKGNYANLNELMKELLVYLGFGKYLENGNFAGNDYLNVAADFGVKELGVKEENAIETKYSPVFFLKNFPEYTSPFFNMKRNGETANKLDVIIYGVETFGTAERETDVEIMRNRFYTISGGEYAKLLFSNFGKERVEDELEAFLSLPQIERFGGGIGMTRLVKALMKLKNESK